MTRMGYNLLSFLLCRLYALLVLDCARSWDDFASVGLNVNTGLRPPMRTALTRGLELERSPGAALRPFQGRLCPCGFLDPRPLAASALSWRCNVSHLERLEIATFAACAPSLPRTALTPLSLMRDDLLLLLCALSKDGFSSIAFDAFFSKDGFTFLALTFPDPCTDS